MPATGNIINCDANSWFHFCAGMARFVAVANLNAITVRSCNGTRRCSFLYDGLSFAILYFFLNEMIVFWRESACKSMNLFGRVYFSFTCFFFSVTLCVCVCLAVPVLVDLFLRSLFASGPLTSPSIPVSTQSLFGEQQADCFPTH